MLAQTQTHTQKHTHTHLLLHPPYALQLMQVAQSSDNEM